jgi:hypothetical protein
VAVTAPPRPPRQSDPVDREELEALVEALIEEARKRAQRRRRRNGALLTLVALVGVAVVAVLGRSAQSQTASPSLAARFSPAAAPAASRIAFTATLPRLPIAEPASSTSRTPTEARSASWGAEVVLGLAEAQDELRVV